MRRFLRFSTREKNPIPNGESRVSFRVCNFPNLSGSIAFDFVLHKNGFYAAKIL